MADECEYSMNGMCFHPEKAKDGVLAVPCHDCEMCTHKEAKTIERTALASES